jgi:hypothetical protein
VSEDVPPYGRPLAVAYVYRCPHCRAENRLDHADLRPFRDQLLGTDWQCERYQGWTWVRVAMPDRQLTIERGSAAGPAYPLGASFMSATVGDGAHVGALYGRCCGRQDQGDRTAKSTPRRR